jgi:hypothetical protein
VNVELAVLEQVLDAHANVFFQEPSSQKSCPVEVKPQTTGHTKPLGTVVLHELGIAELATDPVNAGQGLPAATTERDMAKWLVALIPQGAL